MARSRREHQTSNSGVSAELGRSTPTQLAQCVEPGDPRFHQDPVDITCTRPALIGFPRVVAAGDQALQEHIELTASPLTRPQACSTTGRDVLLDRAKQRSQKPSRSQVSHALSDTDGNSQIRAFLVSHRTASQKLHHNPAFRTAVGSSTVGRLGPESMRASGLACRALVCRSRRQQGPYPGQGVGPDESGIRVLQRRRFGVRRSPRYGT